MVGFCTATKSWRIAFLAIHAIFSTCGSLFHHWTHHAAGLGGTPCCSVSGEHSEGCDDLSDPRHGHSCDGHAVHAVADCHHGAPSPESGNGLEGRSEQGDRASRMKAGSHECRICEQIASLMQSWSATACDTSLDQTESDSLGEVSQEEIAVRPFMARSRAPPSRI
jgi:hypothetical protein